MKKETKGVYHFSQITSKKADIEDEKGLKQLAFISEELNNNLFLFLWIDKLNDVNRFQFFFYEKVIEWSSESGATTNITNRLNQEEMNGKIGIQKGIRTLTHVDDPAMITQTLEIIDQSVFPLGIKDILKSRIT
ncbi:hypothetical protein KJ966_20325 [bacterium]|nr:hypothetical protein [bacterium]